MRATTVILLNTPWWVFGLFVLLIWLGLRAQRPRTLPVWQLLITPAVFIGWGIASVAVRSVSSPILLFDWLVTAVIAAAVAIMVIRLDDVRIDQTRRLISVPGSYLPLIRNLVIFVAKYALAVAIAILPSMRDELYVWDIAVSGAAAGYFLGWLVRLASIYRRPSIPMVT